MKKKTEKKKKKMILIGIIMLLFLTFVAFPLEFELNLSLGSYAKADDYLKQLYEMKSTIPGFGASLYLSKKVGFFVDAHFISGTGQSTYDKKPLAYSEKHLSIGLQYRFLLYRFSPVTKLDLYFKLGGLFLQYSETFEEKFFTTIPGLCFGAGVIFRLKKVGIGCEGVKNFAYEEIEIQGLDIIERVDFSGFRFSLKGVYTF